MSKVSTNLSTSWRYAMQLCALYLKQPTKTDTLISRLPNSFTSKERKTCQSLFLGSVRNLRRIDWEIGRWVKRKPRFRLRALLHIAVTELLLMPDNSAPKVIDHAVNMAKDTCSQKEASLVNAVLRKVAKSIGENVCLDNTTSAVYYSHPDWLIEHWLHCEDDNTVEALMRWNQEPPPVYVEYWGDDKSDLPSSLTSTAWDRFYQWKGEDWEVVDALLKGGLAYVRDPSTRIPTDLLKVNAGEQVLDLCAAPGGKSVSLIHQLDIKNDPSGLLVSVDIEGKRLKTLEQNLSQYASSSFHCLGADIRSMDVQVFEGVGLPSRYDAVLIDVPCSNTGVLRRRPDARWRLKPGSINEMAALQLTLLEKAALFVRPGGRLLYSTCSLEREENEGVVQQFLAKQDRFELEAEHVSKPWVDGHDGGGAFLMRAKGR